VSCWGGFPAGFCWPAWLPRPWGGAWGRLAEGLARAGLVALVSVPPLRLLALVVRFWREDEQALAGLAALLLVLLGVVVVRHLVA
jgi:hypothetical protein